MTSVTDAVGDTTTITYDQAGRVLTEENPVQAAAGKDTAYTYDADGNLLTATDANGHTTTYTYNAAQRAGERDRPHGPGHDLRLRRRGRPDRPSPTRWDRVTTYTYDNDNNLIGVTDPMGGITTYQYDADDEVTR